MDRAHDWLAPWRAAGEVHWDDKGKTYTFPSGATLTFGYLQTATDRLRYQGAEFQFVGFDELTQFPEGSYTYLFSRLRKPDGMPVPIRMRAASNPGGPGHDWVKLRFNLGLDPATGLRLPPPAGRYFIPAKLADNPHVDHASYLESLSNLSPVERAQLVEGDWGARPPGEMFRREWFYDHLVSIVPAGLRYVRRWDLAATKKRKPGDDPDWTSGHLMGWDPKDRIAYCVDQLRLQDTPGAVAKLIHSTAKADRLRYGRVAVRMEQEPGSAGVAVIEAYQKLLAGHDFAGIRSTGSKTDRALPWARYAEGGLIRVLEAPWVPDWVAEHEAFPQESVHDDQVDSTAGAFLDLAGATQPISAVVAPASSRELTSRSLADNPYHSDRGRLRRVV